MTRGRLALIFVSLLAVAAEARVEGENDGLRYAVDPRTPEQIAAFYEARGFPPPAVDILSRACFLTVTLVNQRRDRVWLELDRWVAREGSGGAVPRITRADWDARWEGIALPVGQRSTFGWTLLPEVRDLHPTEPVGGNITLEPTGDTFTLAARLRTGAHKEGPQLVLEIPGLRCKGHLP